MLIPQETLNTEYWAHNCSAKDGALTYTTNRARCFACNKTKTQATADGEVVTPTTEQDIV